MGLHEGLGEGAEPRAWGSLELRKGKRPLPPRADVLRRFLTSLAFLAGFLYFIAWMKGGGFDLQTLGAPLLVLMLYMFVAYFLRPKAEVSNLGWLDGWVDNPLRISDDWNSFLLALEAILIPGRIIAESVVDLFVLLRQA